MVIIVPMNFLKKWLNQPWPEGSVNLRGLLATQARWLRAWEVAEDGTMVSGWMNLASSGP